MWSGNISFSPFTFDTESGVLMRNGRHLPTPRQTSLLLGILIERAGKVVTREEIESLLWPEENCSDHQLAINRAINNLRMVLRDNSQKSRYIKTFPKLGYSFIAPVTQVAADIQTERPSSVVVPATDAASLPPLLEAENSSRLAAETAESEISLSIDIAHQPPQAFLGQRRFFRTTASRVWWRVGLASGVVLLLLCSTLLMLLTRRKPVLDAISLGVVPFEEQGDVADGLGESFRMDLVDTLSQLPNVQLRASHSLENIEHNEASIRAFSNRMHLDLLLMGKFTERSNDCTLQLELVRGSDAVHVASFQYSGSKNELAIIRDKVQRDIFSNLAVTRRSIQAAHGSTENSEAYGTYLHAREMAYRRTVESLSTAVKQYASAIRYDPDFARAYAGMATAYLADYGFTDSLEDLRKAQASAEKALQIDPDLAEAHAVLGINAFRQDWNFARGEEELRHALELEPHQAAYHAWLAQLLVIEGRFDESLHEIDLAHADDPLWPQIYNIEVGVAAEARNFPRAIEAAQKSIDLSPASSYSRDRLAWCFFEAKRYEEAIAQWRLMATMDKDDERIALEDRGLAAFRQGGVAAYAKTRLDAITHGMTPAMRRHPNDFIPAEWYAFLHDSDHALVELDTIVARHDAGSLDLSINTMFDNLHHDPRFLALLARVGLKLPNRNQQGSLQASLQ